MTPSRIPFNRWAGALALLLGACAGRAAAEELAAASKSPPSTGVRPPYTRPLQPPGLGAKETLAWRKGWELYESRVQLRESLKGASKTELQAAFGAWDLAHKDDVTELLRLRKEAAPETAAKLDAAKAP